MIRGKYQIQKVKRTIEFIMTQMQEESKFGMTTRLYSRQKTLLLIQYILQKSTRGDGKQLCGANAKHFWRHPITLLLYFNVFILQADITACNTAEKDTLCFCGAKAQINSPIPVTMEHLFNQTPFIIFISYNLFFF